MAVYLSPVGGAAAQFFDNNGTPLTGGKLYSYAAGTTTPQTTYTTSAGTIANTNPLILDAAGRVTNGGEIWLTQGQTYKFVLAKSDDTLLGTWDNISNVGDPATVQYTPALTSLLSPGPITVKSALDSITNKNTGSQLIGYLAPYSSAITQTVSTKLSQIVSVKDFGAVGDGVTDDSDAVQMALDVGGVIYGDGRDTYLVTKTLTVTQPVVLRGINILANTAGTFTPGYPTYNAIFHFSGVTGITVDACRFVADGTYAGYVLNFFECNEVSITGNSFVVTDDVSSSTTINLVAKNNDVVISGNSFDHQASAVSDGGGCIWVRNIVTEGNTTDKCQRVIVSDNTIVKTSTDEAIWIAGNNGITEDVIVSNNLLTVSGAGSAITVFPGKFATTSNTTTVNYCSVCSNTIRGSLADTGIKIGAANDTGTSMAGINVYDNVIELSSALYGIRRDTVTLTDSSAYNNFIGIGSGGEQAITGFNYQYDNKIVGTFNSRSDAVYPVATKTTTFGSDDNLWPPNEPLTIRFSGTTAGQRFGLKFSGGYVGEDKNSGLYVAPYFSNANGQRVYLNAMGTDIAQASVLDNSGSVDEYFGPATDNDIKLGNSTYRWSTVFAVTGTINTSDQREKQQIRELSESERAVAVKLKSLVRAFKWNDAVNLKGDGARIHFGVIAQDVAAAFVSEGLDPLQYGIVCYDEWPAVLDDDGNERSPAGNRYGVRYEELMAFIIAAL